MFESIKAMVSSALDHVGTYLGRGEEQTIEEVAPEQTRSVRGDFQTYLAARATREMHEGNSANGNHSRSQQFDPREHYRKEHREPSLHRRLERGGRKGSRYQ